MIFTRVLADILKTRGVASLYSGLAPSVFRAFLVSGSRFSAYEFAMRMFDQGRE
jgi:solute carrier family 25 carnitine/acylcarnitine transporter 20/29